MRTTEELLRNYNSHSKKLSRSYPTLDSVDDELDQQIGHLKRQLASIVSVIGEQVGV